MTERTPWSIIQQPTPTDAAIRQNVDPARYMNGEYPRSISEQNERNGAIDLALAKPRIRKFQEERKIIKASLVGGGVLRRDMSTTALGTVIPLFRSKK